MPARLALAALGLLLWSGAVRAEETPSFLQRGEAFCTDENDFNAYRRTGRLRVASAVESCVVIDQVTRVAVRRKYEQGKTMIRVMQGPYAAYIGWTNGALP